LLLQERQVAVNRALRLGRVPHLAARIIRAIDDAGLLGEGLRIAGTNAIYAYEAAAGLFVDPGITSTEDIDLLMDARQSLRIVAGTNVEDGALINLLRKVDRSFERSNATFRAVNRDGYLVDLIKPLASPAWKQGRESVGKAADELVAAEIAGLAWLENAPAFEAIAIDEKGGPLRLIVPDPRIFAAHKFWVSKRADYPVCHAYPPIGESDRMEPQLLPVTVPRVSPSVVLLIGDELPLPQAFQRQ
jgi:hypothetical protein